MMQLQRFDFRIVFKKGKDMHIADTLSTAPRTTSEQHPFEQDKFSVLKVLFVPTDRLRRLAEHTAADKTSQLLTSIMKGGWPNKQSNTPFELRYYFLVRAELVLQDGVIVKGHKTVNPSSHAK